MLAVGIDVSKSKSTAAILSTYHYIVTQLFFHYKYNLPLILC